MNDKDYVIRQVEARAAYQTDYGEMQPYALKLEGVEDWVQLSQKPTTPAPAVGQTIHGHTYSQKGSKGDFLKFKKVNPEYSSGGSKPQQSQDNAYIIQLLEAIAKEVGVPGVGDVVPSDIEGEPFDLAEIPFD